MGGSYSFYLPTQVEYRPGAVRDIPGLFGQLADTPSGKRVFLVTDSGLLQAGLVEPIMDALKKNGYQTELFDRVQPNPKDVDCDEGGDAIRAFGADLVLAVGGGSVIDSAKAIALLHTHDGKIVQYEGRNCARKKITPIVAVPTTAGTGSEVTRSSVITDTKRRFKFSMRDTEMAPKLAILDPELTYKLPKALTASTGMDAFVHAIEAYTCKAATPFSDAWAKEAMRLIFANLREAVNEGTKEARDNLMLGSTMAGVAFSHADVAAVHCLAEALGGLYDTPHGVANSIFLPVVTAFNSEADPKRHAEAARICGLPVSGLSAEEASDLLVSELRKLSKDIGIPAFRDIAGAREADFERLAEASFINGSTPDNCRDIAKEDYLNILHKAWGEPGA